MGQSFCWLRVWVFVSCWNDCECIDKAFCISDLCLEGSRARSIESVFFSPREEGTVECACVKIPPWPGTHYVIARSQNFMHSGSVALNPPSLSMPLLCGADCCVDVADERLRLPAQ